MKHSIHLQNFVRQNRLLVVVFLAALLIAGWFAFNVIANFVFFNDPRNQDGDLKGWMNPHFISEMYDLPRPVIEDILELPANGRQGRPLKDIAAELGLTMDELTERVRDGAAAYRSGQQ